MRKGVRHIGSFEANDSTGNSRTVHVFTDIISAGSMGNPNAELEGIKSLETADGLSVNFLGKGKYQVVQTGEILTSKSDDAP